MAAAMHTSQRSGHRLGQYAGRAWRWLARAEARAVRWLEAQGIPGGLARALPWIAKLVALGILLYVAFWVTLLLVFAVTAAWMAKNSDYQVDEATAEWRDGFSGFGLYNKTGHRIDPHSAEDDD